MQPLTAIRASDTSTTLPATCLFSQACGHRSISTGKQRDSETGNDYFGARYYSSDAGRFLSPDWAAKTEPVPYAKLGNPQSLNLYDYMRDNPFSGVDPDGHDPWDKLDNYLHGRGWRNTPPPPPVKPLTIAVPEWHFSQSSGTITEQVKVTSGNGKSVSEVVSSLPKGYSGHGRGLDNPKSQSVSEANNRANAGPLPRGQYAIGPPVNNRLGRPAMKLTPNPTNQMFGRGHFWIHADNPSLPRYSSSEGCIVTPLATRLSIAGSGINELEVDW